MKGRGGDHVYEPAEDTFLLARGVSAFSPLVGLAAEIGCGGGLITEVLAEYAKEVVATDASFACARATWQRVKSKGLGGIVHVVCCDRLEAVRVGGLFEFISFNPPYLPDEGDPCWAGGPTGIEAPLAFAYSASMRLKKGGCMLFILSSLSNWVNALLTLRLIGYIVSVARVERVGLFEDLLLVLCARRMLNTGNPHSEGVTFKVPITDEVACNRVHLLNETDFHSPSLASDETNLRGE